MLLWADQRTRDVPSSWISTSISTEKSNKDYQIGGSSSWTTHLGFCASSTTRGKLHSPSSIWLDVHRLRPKELRLKLHDQYPFFSLEIFKNRLRQTFEPPRAEFRACAESLQLKQGQFDEHASAQHIKYRSSYITANSLNEHTNNIAFIEGLTKGVVKTHLFRLTPKSLSHAILVAEQAAFKY